MPVKYILVDDDPLSNMFPNRIIRMALGKADIKIFNSREEALAYTQNVYSENYGPTLLTNTLKALYVNLLTRKRLLS